MVSLSLQKLKIDMFIIFIHLYLILFYGTIRIMDESITLTFTVFSLQIRRRQDYQTTAIVFSLKAKTTLNIHGINLNNSFVLYYFIALINNNNNGVGMYMCILTNLYYHIYMFMHL